MCFGGQNPGTTYETSFTSRSEILEGICGQLKIGMRLRIAANDSKRCAVPIFESWHFLPTPSLKLLCFVKDVLLNASRKTIGTGPWEHLPWQTMLNFHLMQTAATTWTDMYTKKSMWQQDGLVVVSWSIALWLHTPSSGWQLWHDSLKLGRLSKSTYWWP